VLVDATVSHEVRNVVALVGVMQRQAEALGLVPVSEGGALFNGKNR
jgi:hypothetical protein